MILKFCTWFEFCKPPKQNPTKRCCHACVMCPLLITRCSAESMTLRQKIPINLPYPKQFFNCKSKNVTYLIICTTPGCGAQYVGYTTRGIPSRIFEHLNEGPMINHIKQETTNTRKLDSKS